MLFFRIRSNVNSSGYINNIRLTISDAISYVLNLYDVISRYYDVYKVNIYRLDIEVRNADV